MDNIISPRTFFTSNKSSSAYDDVFGARPRLPLPTLAPRLEDYSEIFVDASRSFSIPVLDLPILTGADDHSNHFHDYAEIFDSDEPRNRSPAQSGALFDPSDKSLSLSDDDAHHSLEATDQFNASYNNNDNSSQSIYGEGENCSLSSVDDPSLNAIKEHDQRVAQEKQHTNCDFINLSDNHENFTCKPFMTVSDISLRTKPSLLPPPSRPPPALSVQKGDSDTSELEPKASKSYALERLADDSSSLSSDFELVAATLSPEGTENGNKDVDNYDGVVEWGEGNEYFEVIENNISKKALDITEDCDIFLPCQVLNEAQGLEKQRRQPEVTNEQKEIPNKGLNDRKRFQEKVVQSKLTSQHSLNKTGTEDFHQFVECGKLPIDDCETLEVLREGEGNLIEMDAKGVDIEKKSVVAQMARQNSGKQNQNIPMEEFQRRLENVEGAKNMDQPLSCEVEKDNEKLFEVGIQVKNELMYEDSLQQARNEKEHKLIHEREVTEERNRDAHRIEGSDLRFRRVDTDRGHTSGFFKTKGHISLSRTAGVQKEPNKYAKEIQPIEINEHEKEVELTATTVSRKQYNEGNERLKVDLIDHEGKPIGLSKHKNKGIAVDITCRGPLIQDTPPFISKTVHAKDSFIPCPVIRESSTINGAEKHSDDTLCSIENATNQKIEIKNYNNFKDDLATKDQKVEERIRREIELENEHIRKIEEEKEREREREKDRMAVDKAALEACERSYTEARERAAVDRVTAEVRQRAIAGARERMENSSMETKLRIERAAIERATSEARERAAGKSMSQIAVSQAHFRVERSASFKYSDMRQSSLSIDTQLKNTGITSNLRYSYSFGYTGADSESPQRCKARLERYRRTAERAENALAEKNMRDLLVQREREEINRVAETLDSEIKRWSSGKEANLRALLSTLQYILGPDSGWQPVPLTEVITCAAVKRAYRKATLCVHPDKLQQRGATIHQKYICEKVFDLLKEAWNRFNSEEM